VLQQYTGKPEMIKPGKLDKGNKIGLLAPASFITEEQLAKSVKNLEDFGFKAVYNETILSRIGYLAGNDAQRAEEILRMFLDPEIKAIHCVRGGYGALRILPLIDYNVIARNPKPIIGYSDITAILNAINQRSKVVCFHGPMGISEFLPFTFSHFWNVLTNSEDEFVPLYAGSFSSETKDPAYNSFTIRDGIAEGQLVGGNLSIIASVTGTPYVVPGAGIEPARYRYHWCLRPARLPIPPPGHGAKILIMFFIAKFYLIIFAFFLISFIYLTPPK
jgi:muramoyltetrapeptide carboxypeptidase